MPIVKLDLSKIYDLKTLKEIELILKDKLKSYPDLKLPVHTDFLVEDSLIIGTIKDYSKVCYVLSYCERGKLFELIKTDSFDDFLFEVCRTLLFDLAATYEAKNRIKHIDFRVILFAKHIEMLTDLEFDDLYLKRLKEKYNNLLGVKIYLTKD